MGFIDPSQLDPAEPTDIGTIGLGGNSGGRFITEADLDPLQQESTTRDYVMGGLKGIAKAGTEVLTAPADLLYRGGNAALDWLTGSDTNIEGGYPSDYVNRAVEYVSGGQGDDTAEGVTNTLGNIASLVAAPSQAGRIAANIPVLSRFASGGGGLANRAVGLFNQGAGLAAEGAAISTLLDRKEDDPLANAAASGATNVAIGGGLGLVGRAVRGLAGRLDDSAQYVRERGLGVQYGDRSRGLGSMPMYLDDAGNVVPKSQASSVEASIQSQISLLKDKGLLQGAPDKADELKVYLARKGESAGEDIQKLIGEADTELVKKGFGTLTVPFLQTKKTLDTIARENPGVVPGLAKEFEKVIENYKQAGTYVNPLTKQVEQQAIGPLARVNAIKRGTKHEIDLWNKQNDRPKALFYKAVYKDLQAFEDRVFDAALPSKTGQFKEAKDLFGALEAVGNTVNKAAARKSVTLWDSLQGGSKPIGIMAGIAGLGGGLQTGLTVAALGGLGKAGLNVLENSRPLTAANLYERGAQLAQSIGPTVSRGGLLSGRAASAIPALSSNAPLPTESSGEIGRGIREANTLPDSRKGSATGSKKNPYPEPPSDPAGKQGLLRQAFKALESNNDMAPEKRSIAAVEAEIDQDPYYSALYEAESGRNPKAKNPESTASGGFQFLKGTAKLVGLSDPFDLEESFVKVQELTDDHREKFGDDPELLYSAHYLGATVLNKVINGKPLTRKEQAQVDYLKEKALPRFLRIYNKVRKRGQVEA